MEFRRKANGYSRKEKKKNSFRFVLFLATTWRCLGFLRVCTQELLWLCLGGHMECQCSNPVQFHVKQETCSLHSLWSPLLLSLFFKFKYFLLQWISVGFHYIFSFLFVFFLSLLFVHCFSQVGGRMEVVNKWHLSVFTVYNFLARWW